MSLHIKENGFQDERIDCPFCADPANGGVAVKLESNGQHSRDYPDTPEWHSGKVSLCGGCNNAEFEVRGFSFHRCPRCKTVFIEPFGQLPGETTEDYIKRRKKMEKDEI
jgi:phage FluMu protein Com